MLIFTLTCQSLQIEEIIVAEPSTDESDENIDDDADDNIFENYIRDLFKDMDQNPNSTHENETAAWEIICQYKDKQPLSTNVLQYWFSKRFTHPLLYKLSNIVLGVPASQVSVERCFSILKFVFSDYRTRLQPDILQDIMLVKLN